MARKSSVEQIPDALLSKLNGLIGTGDLTIDELTEWLGEKGHPKSRSAVGRYAKDIRKVAAEIERSTRIAEAVVKEIGPAAAEGKTGRLLVSILQKLIFDHLMNRIDGADNFDADEFYKLTRAVRELFMALGLDAERETKLREQVAKETAKKAAAVVAKEARKAGLDKKTIDTFRRNILGIGNERPAD